MAHRTNNYPGTCNRCGEAVPAHEGTIYRVWPYQRTQPWLVACGDETACGERVAAAKAATVADYRDRHLTGEAHGRAVAIAAKYAALPKTVTYQHNDLTITYARRLTKTGCTVTNTVTLPDRIEKFRQQFHTEEDAIAYIVRQLEIAAKPFLGQPKPAAAAVLATYGT